MKPSHLQTPRTLDQCYWTPGYEMPPSRDERFNTAMKGVVLAVVIAVGLAAVLFFGWSK